jgi:hypothetical protein
VTESLERKNDEDEEEFREEEREVIGRRERRIRWRPTTAAGPKPRWQEAKVIA